MIAGLPMYDRPGTTEANDAFWALIRDELGFGPVALTRDIDTWDLWLSPDLVLAQTCNLPYRMRLHGKVHLLGSPDYRLPGCPPGYYNSVLVARADDPRSLPELFGARVVINQQHSQSGHVALTEHGKTLGVVPTITGESGGHVLSSIMVAEDRADLAAIDALSWRLIERHDPDRAARLRTVDRTQPTPSTPYITSLSQDADTLRSALIRAIDRMDTELRETLSIHGLVPLPERAYLDLPIPAPQPA